MSESYQSIPEILITAPLTKWMELDFGEAVTVLPNSMTFADADNDGMSEFVAGSVQGDLFIFKSLSPKYWRKSSDRLGMITAVGAGDIMRKKKNIIYAVTGEGSLYTFGLSPGQISLDVDGTKSRDNSSKNRMIDANYVQKIPPNIVMSVLADIDGDGYPEILFGMTDRVVRSFKWVESAPPGCGSFITLNKWEFAGQIGNLSSALSDGVAEIFVSQPGGSCCRLKACVSLNTNSILEMNFEPPVYHNPTASRSRNPLMQTQVLAGVSFRETDSRARCRQNSADRSKNIYALCSFDGTLSVCNEDTVLWEHQTCEHLIGIYPLPLRDEFIIAAASGAVYIVNEDKKMLKLLTTENINGFAAGLFGTISGNGDHVNTCAFATICSGGRIFVYHNMDIPNLSTLPSLWRRPKKRV